MNCCCSAAVQLTPAPGANLWGEPPFPSIPCFPDFPTHTGVRERRNCGKWLKPPLGNLILLYTPPPCEPRRASMSGQVGLPGSMMNGFNEGRAQVVAHFFGVHRSGPPVFSFSSSFAMNRPCRLGDYLEMARCMRFGVMQAASNPRGSIRSPAEVGPWSCLPSRLALLLTTLFLRLQATRSRRSDEPARTRKHPARRGLDFNANCLPYCCTNNSLV